MVAEKRGISVLKTAEEKGSKGKRISVCFA